jgi:hypothetical protein
VVAHVSKLEEVMFAHNCEPDTAMGIELVPASPDVPLPSCPRYPSPQQYALPEVVTPHV